MSSDSCDNVLKIFIFDVDSYTTRANYSLDKTVSKYRKSKVSTVTVMRLFGCTEQGMLNIFLLQSLFLICFVLKESSFVYIYINIFHISPFGSVILSPFITLPQTRKIEAYSTHLCMIWNVKFERKSTDKTKLMISLFMQSNPYHLGKFVAFPESRPASHQIKVVCMAFMKTVNHFIGCIFTPSGLWERKW